jgi:hypothetical protein
MNTDGEIAGASRQLAPAGNGAAGLPAGQMRVPGVITLAAIAAMEPRRSLTVRDLPDTFNRSDCERVDATV